MLLTIFIRGHSTNRMVKYIIYKHFSLATFDFELSSRYNTYMPQEIVRSRLFERMCDMAVPVLSWLMITFPIWMSPFHPAVVAYFILTFNLYFLYKSTTTAYYAVVSYLNILENQYTLYHKKVLKVKKSADIHHFIIVPNYKETLSKLEQTINGIVSGDYPYKNLYLVLAFETREEEARDKAKALQDKYANNFKDILVTYHTLEPHEVAGKASNQTHAAKQVSTYVREKNIATDQTLITISDADSLFPKNYFSYLTYTYLQDTDRTYHFYWAPVLLYNNFWRLPFFVRMQATLSSIFRLALLSQKDKLIQVSTYSTSLTLIERVGYWDVDIIPEDWHIYLQAFFMLGTRVHTVPLYTIVNGDAVYSGGFFKTFINRYEQEKRWAWGVSDIGYSLKQLFTSHNAPVTAKLKKIGFLAETHLLWPTSFFILTVSAAIPPLINPVFKRTVLGFLLPQFSSLILTVSTLFLLVYTYLDIKLRHRLKQKTAFYAIPFLIVQWYLLPIISFILSALPALDAHTRMILGKKLDYKVTEKA